MHPHLRGCRGRDGRLRVFFVARWCPTGRAIIQAGHPRHLSLSGTHQRQLVSHVLEERLSKKMNKSYDEELIPL